MQLLSLCNLAMCVTQRNPVCHSVSVLQKNFSHTDISNYSTPVMLQSSVKRLT